MRRRSRKDLEEVEEVEVESEELDEKELKKKKREESKAKRKKAKKQDKAARWAGAVMLFIVMITGFLMWVSGEIGQGMDEQVSPFGETQTTPVSTPQGGKVIVR